MADDRMTINHGLQDWQLGFKSAISGWADIPPAGVDRVHWLSGWHEGRKTRQEADQQGAGAWRECRGRQESRPN
jgi:hypothetical protein